MNNDQMYYGNKSPTQHLPWWLRKTTKRTPVSLVSTGIWTRNSPDTSPVSWISIGAMLCAFKNFITDRTSQSGGCWNKSLHLQPLQRCYCENSGSPDSSYVMRCHYSYHVHAIASRNKWFTSGGTSGKISLWMPLVHYQNNSRIYQPLPYIILINKNVFQLKSQCLYLPYSQLPLTREITFDGSDKVK